MSTELVGGCPLSRGGLWSIQLGTRWYTFVPPDGARWDGPIAVIAPAKPLFNPPDAILALLFRSCTRFC